MIHRSRIKGYPQAHHTLIQVQECAAHSNKYNNSKLTLKQNILIVITANRELDKQMSNTI